MCDDLRVSSDNLTSSSLVDRLVPLCIASRPAEYADELRGDYGPNGLSWLPRAE
jgi:hypothetical protein